MSKSPLSQRARDLFTALDRGSAMIADNLELGVTPREMLIIKHMLAQSVTQEQLAEELHLIPTVGDLLDSLARPKESGAA